MVRLLQEKEPPAESSEIDAVFSEKRRSSSLESEVFVGDDAVTGGSRQELQTLTCYHQSLCSDLLILKDEPFVSGEDWRWSSTDLRKQRRHRPFTSSLKIRSCLKSRQLRIDPRLPPLPLPELYLRVVIGRDLRRRGKKDLSFLLPSRASSSLAGWNGTRPMRESSHSPIGVVRLRFDLPESSSVTSHDLLTATEGDKPKIEELLRAGASYTVKDADGRTALDRANSEEICDLILGYSTQKA
ncbi:hypothetical protein Bca52824_064851 [Brassica carinata]|uniref:Uncharacterized protein n=1 Tax=Brassica carinata TaxID=52824 RepID=A0A8X7QH53_BRACI|nr:hypothetical protein Bca52824_064851 [Brassica carinata]